MDRQNQVNIWLELIALDDCSLVVTPVCECEVSKIDDEVFYTFEKAKDTFQFRTICRHMIDIMHQKTAGIEKS